jgi:predicted transcriptional regulator
MKTSKIAMRGFHPTGNGIEKVLGKLEAEVMRALWQQPGQTVSEVEEKLRRKREIARTTVLTTLDRMYHKGYLTREKQGKAFVYAPRYTREQFDRVMAQEVLGALLGGAGEPLLSTFVDLVGRDEGQLDRLEELIKERRKGRK